ncbi:MAG: diacylglycerol kinase family lipid kinase [Anaerolineae bacterium]|nr:diacylglycerol kinase family lipid kinase [Thermoflexales bacterium]MDW8407153.1 diacylglycerol kinase family lipid kinase [Anaerolineae bacterium]
MTVQTTAPSAKKLRIIVNPAAARGRAGKTAAQLRALIETDHSTAHIEWTYTERPGHAVELTRQAGESGCEVVAVMGGDGTVHEVANGLMQIDRLSRPALAIVPIGSGNDFVSGAELWQDPLTALQRTVQACNGGLTTRWLDLGYVQDNRGRSEYFVNVIGIGLDASVAWHAQHMPGLSGFAMYFAALMRTLTNNYGAIPISLGIDDELEVRKPVLMIAIANGTREGGGFKITPAARIDDGELDLAMIGPVSRVRLLQLIPDVMAGTHARHPEITLRRIRRIHLRSEHPLLSHFDGEIFSWHGQGVREMLISVEPAAVKLVI